MNIKSIVAIKRLSLIFSLVIACINVFAYDFEVDGIYYNKLSSSEVEVTFKSVSDKGYSGQLKIPELVSYNGITYSVVGIGKYAFLNCDGLTGDLEIPNSVTTIGPSAFKGCSGFTGSLTMPSSVTSIGESAFQDCSGFTGSLTIANSVKSIGSMAFYGCSGFTGSLEIPKSVTSLGNHAFNGCRGFAGSLTIPNSVTSIGNYAFYGCSGFTGSLTIPNSVTSIGESAFSGCSGFTGSLTISSSVTSIGNYAFLRCSGFTGSLEIPNSVTTIGNFAFDFCSGFTGPLTLSNSLKSIGDYAFRDCSGFIGSLTIPSSVTSIGTSAFIDCSGFTGSLTILNSVRSIGTSAFSGCSGFTGSLTIPSSVTSIGGGAFYRCSGIKKVLSKIEYPFEIPDNVFEKISLEALLFVPQGAKSKYEVFLGWTKHFVNVLEEGNNLLITVSGNGSITYNKTVVREETQSFSVNEGDNATILFSPDKGYNIKNVKMNNNDITAEISNNSYTVKNITDLVVLNVQFENLVDSLDNELRTLNNQLGRVRSRQIELELRLNKLSIEYKDNADAVKQISQLNQKLTNCFVAIFNLQTRIDSFGSSLVDGYIKGELTSSFKKEELEEIRRDLDALFDELDEVEKEIDELVNSQPFVSDGVSFMHVPNDEQKVVVSTGDYGHVLRVPATVTQNGVTWTVAGIETDALKDNTELAAVVWEPSVAFTATVSNPNLLLYVKSANYAPAAIKNVVVNGVANSITLTDAASGNSFYCAQSFTARTISYQHTYEMTTGIGESRGWETISLPFDVQNISHKTKGDIVPFARWNGGDAVKPFWLYELTGIGFVEASNIKANTPYIISMPNNGRYDSQWQLSGTVTFSASNVVVDETENLHTTFYLDRTFVPNFTEKGASEGLYALNVNNDYSTDNSGMPEGSKFVLNMRPLHPFEAYMTTASNARQMIDIFEGMTTEITGIYEIPSEKGPTYDLQGRKVAGVKKGVYIKDGRKVIIK